VKLSLRVAQRAPDVVGCRLYALARDSGRIGLDRALMLRKGIDDIRLLRSPDPRVASQMRDLEHYRPVSSQPLVRRDLSVAVAPDTTPEELGDRVRAALGDRVADVEAIEVVSETPGAELPPQAVERLGLRPGQKNVLLRIVLRHPTQTLTDEEANRLRDAIYAAVHEGTAWTWAAR
jgi:phenylalanyl-tRNA synthetase alpha chain